MSQLTVATDTYQHQVLMKFLYCTTAGLTLQRMLDKRKVSCRIQYKCRPLEIHRRTFLWEVPKNRIVGALHILLGLLNSLMSLIWGKDFSDGNTCWLIEPPCCFSNSLWRIPASSSVTKTINWQQWEHPLKSGGQVWRMLKKPFLQLTGAFFISRSISWEWETALCMRATLSGPFGISLSIFLHSMIFSPVEFNKGGASTFTYFLCFLWCAFLQHGLEVACNFHQDFIFWCLFLCNFSFS